MRVLVACEYSGMVRDAFTNKGHDAISCDILPTESPGNHYQGDVFDIINDGFDMMIAFPPCTYLSSVQTFLCRNNPERVLNRVYAAEFFMKLYLSKIPKISVENPTGVMSHIFRQPDQIIHPFYFGGTSYKRTCLWLKDLPKLKSIKYDDLFETSTFGIPDLPIKSWVQKSTGMLKNQRHITTPFLSSKERSKLSPYIAQAMAEQWG